MDIEKLLNKAYKKIRKNFSASSPVTNCPTDEDLACFFDKRMSAEQQESLTNHLRFCVECAAKVKDQFLIQATLNSNPLLTVPTHLTENAKALFSQEAREGILDIVLHFADRAIQLIETTGEILMGSQLIPVPALRSSGKDQELLNQIKIVKSFKEIVVEVEVEKQRSHLADVAIRIAEKEKSKKPIGYRVSLFKADRELSSLLLEQGKAKFEEIKVGRYKIIISKDGTAAGVVNLTLSSDK